jgi:hypothetical protein
MKKYFKKIASNAYHFFKNPIKYLLIIYVARSSCGKLNLFDKIILSVCSVILLPFLQDGSKRLDYLRYLQSRGVSAVPNRYFEPIPTVTEVDIATRDVAMIANSMPPITEDMAELKIKISQPKEISKFEEEVFSAISSNSMLGPLDSFAYTFFIQKYRPNLIMEIGSGYSAYVALKASNLVGLDTNVISLEPFPSEFLLGLSKNYTRHQVVVETIQDYFESNKKEFLRLDKNDILFIDSTHVCSVGGDLPVIFCQLLPLLKKGVIIHVHDVSWPFEYPRQLVFNSGRFYNELYLVASLLNHDDYEYLFGSYHMLMEEKAWLKVPSISMPYSTGMSLYIRKK